MNHNILVVDDDKTLRASMAQFFNGEGYFVKTVPTGDEAIAFIRQGSIPFSLAFVDYNMPTMKGPEVIAKMRELNPLLPIVGFSGVDSNETHNESLDSGAIMFVSKETDNARLLSIVQRICRDVERRSKPFEPIDESVNRRIIESLGLVGASESLANTAKLVLKLAPANDCVLIRGENGTGKEVVAKAVHQNSSRHRGPFIAINCASIPEALIESELFGHERGAFSGAVSARIGKFQAANGGTIFLDEIGDMPFALQAKLLRVLQEKEITPVGSNATKKIDVRVIAATNADLESKIAEKSFREDLFYRLNVLPISIAPLRDRPADIPFMIKHFIDLENKATGANKRILESCVRELQKWPWPGNVRDLLGAIKRLHLLTDGDVISEDSLLFIQKVKRTRKGELLDYDNFRFRCESEERELILEALARASGVIADAARILNLRRETLRDRIKTLGIKSETKLNA